MTGTSVLAAIPDEDPVTATLPRGRRGPRSMRSARTSQRFMLKVTREQVSEFKLGERVHPEVAAVAKVDEVARAEMSNGPSSNGF